MTDGEIEALMAPFPDDAIEIRPHDGLIYIPHIHISNRLNKIFRPGKWSLIRRRDWFDADTNTMYGEYVLVVRGCFVGESIGGHPYVAKNPKTNFSDALESTAAEALRRICGKRLSCGSQVWEPEFARQWVAKYGVQVHGKWQRRMTQDTPERPATQRPAQAPKASPAQSQSAKPPAAMASRVEEWKQYALGQICKLSMEPFAYALAMETSWLIPGVDKLEDISAQKFPQNKDAFEKYWVAIKERKQKAIDEGGMSQEITEAFDKAYLALPLEEPPKKAPPAPPSQARSQPPPINVPRDTNDPDSPNAPWRSFPMPWGKHAGAKLADLDKKYLFGLFANYVVETTYNGKQKNDANIAKDRTFRAMLDEAGAHYKFTNPDAGDKPQEERLPSDADLPFDDSEPPF